MVTLLEKPLIVDSGSDTNDEIVHLYCSTCRPLSDLALCGEDILDGEEYFKGEVDPSRDCVVCWDLDLTHKCKDEL